MKRQLHLFLSLLFTALFVPDCGLFAQSAPIKGTVTDDQNQALPGVNVVVKGTSTGTLTNADGTFSLTPTGSTPTNGVLVFSFIGYTNAEVPITGQTTIIVQLKANNQMLNEVVVTALGIRREEKTLGYSATTINENVVK
ncbi:MAG: carboxypeptidase-like regulatory domain-containing protein, partial [Bacteroidetes bacterium]|nr:carboxypeptidase-like regulatory domain-containing protein [Fibrella sp.]